MKINYRNTALCFLEDPKKVAIHTPEAYSIQTDEAQNLKLLYGLRDQFAEPGFADHFNKNIQFVTQPFYEAYQRSRDKLKDVVQKTAFDDSGTLIIKWPEHTQTIFYMLKSNGMEADWDFEVMITMFTKATRNDSFGLDVMVYLGKEQKEMADYVWKGFVEQGRDMTWWITDLMLFKTFLKYAEVETKVIPGYKKDHHIGTKYVNETKRKVEILDSTYFTTISRTEGFGVRGHFRFQPYGPGMSQKKLIWISEFEKHGYTRTAKIVHD